jgi:hypothetical protein
VKLEVSYPLRVRIFEKKAEENRCTQQTEVTGTRRKSDKEALSNMNSSTNIFMVFY